MTEPDFPWMTTNNFLLGYARYLSDESGKTFTVAYRVDRNLSETVSPNADGIFRLVIPGEVVMERPGRGDVTRSEAVAVVYLGLMADLSIVPDILDEIRNLMRFSVRCGGPMRLYGGLARSCRTLGGCVGGYVASSLAADTPQLMGGFETTFWRS